MKPCFIYYIPKLCGANYISPFLFTKSRYFIVKSCNRENLELSVQQGVWATQRSNEAKLNEAFDSVENIILIFSVNRTRHFQVGYEELTLLKIPKHINVYGFMLCIWVSIGSMPRGALSF